MGVFLILSFLQSVFSVYSTTTPSPGAPEPWWMSLTLSPFGIRTNVPPNPRILCAVQSVSSSRALMLYLSCTCLDLFVAVVVRLLHLSLMLW